MNAPDLTAALKDEARRIGFHLAGACPAVPPPGLTRFHEWLQAGYAGQMQYLPDRAAAYAHPEHVLSGVRSVLMLAWPYKTVEPIPPQPGQGRIARYAWGNDYHDLVRAKLNKLAEYLVAAAPGAIARGVVDTAPLLEREYAQLAGLGWIGKNTLLLNRSEGSWFFLAALLTDQSLDYDEPHAADHCGSCRACLDACPTDAFVRPYVLDARRCVSYLTIEHRTAIPEALRGGIGNWVLGCDICQDVCPWNRKSPATDEPALAPNEQSNPIELAELFALDDRAFRQRFGGTPLWRPKRRGILRNAAIVLGNQRDPNAVPALIRGLADPEPLVRGACAWALGRFNSTVASTALERRRPIETDDLVRAEIDLVLRAHARATSQG